MSFRQTDKRVNIESTYLLLQFDFNFYPFVGRTMNTSNGLFVDFNIYIQ